MVDSANTNTTSSGSYGDGHKGVQEESRIGEANENDSSDVGGGGSGDDAETKDALQHDSLSQQHEHEQRPPESSQMHAILSSPVPKHRSSTPASVQQPPPATETVDRTTTLSSINTPPTHGTKSRMNRRRDCDSDDSDSDDADDVANKSSTAIEKNIRKKSKTALSSYPAQTHRTKSKKNRSRRNRNRNRRHFGSSDEDDENENGVTNKSIADEKDTDIKSRKGNTVSSYPAQTHRKKSKMTRSRTRRTRRDFGSSDDEDDCSNRNTKSGMNISRASRRSRRNFGDDDDDDDDDSFNGFDGDDDNHTRRSEAESARISTNNSDVYNSVGAVAVYSTGELVSQRPAVLTQPNPEVLQRHEEEESQNSPAFDADFSESIDEEATNNASDDRSIPLGDDDSSNRPQNNHGTSNVATATTRSTTTRVGANSSSGAEKRKSKESINEVREEENSVKLPWYWSQFLWGMVGLLIVVLGVILAVVLVSRDKKPEVVPSSPPSPTIAPTVPFDPIKVEAFATHIAVEGGLYFEDTSSKDTSSKDTLKGQSIHHLKAYDWLMTVDKTTNFSENMSEDEIGIMKTRYSLAVFYYALGGDKWFSSGITSDKWLDSSLDHCKWKFVDCRLVGQGQDTPDTPFRPVTGLKIEDNNLYGALPNELVHLSNLGMYTLLQMHQQRKHRNFYSQNPHRFQICAPFVLFFRQQVYLYLKGNMLESVKVFRAGLDSLSKLSWNIVITYI